jgi:hypothetical protein
MSSTAPKVVAYCAEAATMHPAPATANLQQHTCRQNDATTCSDYYKPAQWLKIEFVHVALVLAWHVPVFPRHIDAMHSGAYAIVLYAHSVSQNDAQPYHHATRLRE